MKKITLTQPASIRGMPREAGFIVTVGDTFEGEDIISEPCARGLIQSGKAKESGNVATSSTSK